MLPTEIKVGHVFRYSYLWHWQHLEGREEGDKDGPCLVLALMNQSGESNRVGRISLCGDIMMRTLLYEAAQVMLTVVRKWSWLKAWAMNIARRRGHQKAIVALARRLAVIMHRMWSDGTDFQWSKDSGPAKA
ncbi:transposase [Sinorhizobium medicae]|nr:transposase [Sinorhizobium medicae]MDX0747368.1 transposase [Sinorhizobium medicae]